MKVKYEFEINKQHYHKVLCEGCKLLGGDEYSFWCPLSGEYATHYYSQPESHRIAALSFLEYVCPLEVLE